MRGEIRLAFAFHIDILADSSETPLSWATILLAAHVNYSQRPQERLPIKEKILQ